MNTHTTHTPPPITTGDAQLDVYEVTEMLLEALARARASDDETPETRRANTYLYEKLMNYRVLMRKRTLDSAYEFLAPHNGKGAGWYYASTGPARNWVGPFPSRKAAVEAKLHARGKRGEKQPTKTLDMIELEIFGEVL